MSQQLITDNVIFHVRIHDLKNYQLFISYFVYKNSTYKLLYSKIL